MAFWMCYEKVNSLDSFEIQTVHAMDGQEEFCVNVYFSEIRNL